MGVKLTKDLTVSNILSRISEYDIFMTYCTPFKGRTGAKFKSELREDTTPSCSVYITVNDTLAYKDFAEDLVLNCFKYMILKYNVNFNIVLNMINRDFDLKFCSSWPKGIDTTINKAVGTMSNKKLVRATTKIEIKKRKRIWKGSDSTYWFKKYTITRKTLNFFNVQPIDYYWIKGMRFKCDNTTYSIEFGDGYRDLYAPGNTYSHFPASNTKADTHIYGYEQLPKTGDFLFITSSNKECMLLYEYGICSVAPQSENSFLPEWMVEELKTRFDNIVILYDMDIGGNKYAKKYGEQYNLKYCQFEKNFKDKYGFKDLSDGVEQNKELIEEILNNYERYI